MIEKTTLTEVQAPQYSAIILSRSAAKLIGEPKLGHEQPNAPWLPDSTLFYPGGYSYCKLSRSSWNGSREASIRRIHFSSIATHTQKRRQIVFHAAASNNKKESKENGMRIDPGSIPAWMDVPSRQARGSHGFVFDFQVAEQAL